MGSVIRRRVKGLRDWGRVMKLSRGYFEHSQHSLPFRYLAMKVLSAM